MTLTLVRPWWQRNLPTRLDGFTLIEVIVALAVLLILAAVALPNLAGVADQKRVDAAATQLVAISLALYDPTGTTKDFYSNVGAHAGRLSELDSVIIVGDATYATGTANSCGGTFSNGQRNGWLAAGPFTQYRSDRTFGLQTPIGMAADSLTRIPNSASFGVQRITFINDVDLNDAVMLDAKIDGGNGYNAGIVQWTPQNGTNGLVTMYWYLVLNAAC